MKSKSKKSMLRNMSASLINQAIVLIAGLIMQRYILVAFGSTYNGLTSFISQIMSYLVLLEAGLGAASIQAFYKPLSEDDWNSVSGIMNATSVSYRRVGFMFTALLIGGSLLVPLAVKGEADFFVAAMLTLITGASHIVVYMFTGKYATFLSAERKMYIRYTLTSISTVASLILRIVALKFGCGIVALQLINLICVILFNALPIIIYVKLKYSKLDRSVPPDFFAIGKRWNVMVHQLSGLVVNHTDTLILAFAGSLKIVSVYNIYNMIFGHLGTLVVSTFRQAPQGDFGRIYASDRENFGKLYVTYEVFFTLLMFIVSSIALILCLPFIRLYTAGVTDVAYVDIWLPILFVLIFLMNYIRTPALLTIDASGAFRETQKGAIVEMILNLSLSLVLFIFTDLGIYGLLIGTIVSYIFRTIDVFVFVYRNILKRSLFKLLRLLLVNFMCFGTLLYVFYVVVPLSPISYMNWLLQAIWVSLLSILSYIVFNLIFNFKDTKLMIKSMLGKIGMKIK